MLGRELGYTSNEPVSFCVSPAIESAVVYMIADGIWKRAWNLADPQTGVTNSILQKYWLEAHDDKRVVERIKQE
ncbi:CsgG/HfaB family protein [Shewanella surugensis]|uniref:CsgG/HfaB family protein n=1 Tax=Shewanella surugensis TaxID=212020 RepID=UPI0024B2839D|nr:CsgG/HfaB family protein [Shewanella surugensis]